MNDFWIILSGSLVAASCGILGVFLMLRKMSMVGDAISHAVLPGIVIAYLISGSRNSEIMLLAAALTGVLASVIIEWLYRKARVQSDASTGITFTLLFAIGVILISRYAGQVDIDQDCVLFGEIALIPLDLWRTDSGLELGPRAIWLLSANFLLVLAFVLKGYRGLFITTFDAAFAAGIGISTAFWHYSLMSFVSLTTVFSFEAVGAILVVAFLVIPPATAYLLSNDLRRILLYAVLVGVSSAISGYYFAVYLNSSVAASMAVASGVHFLLALLFSPTSGLFFRSRKALSEPGLDSFSRQQFPISGKPK